jgi:Mn-dependent DtxR family transcriptional regulator
LGEPVVTPEEFEEEIDNAPVEIEVLPPEPERSSKISPQIADQLVYSKQVARALMNGMSIAEVAERLGVSDSVVRKRVNSGPMSDLLEIEARRVIRHLGGRELDKEKYLGLSTALCGMIDKIRLLRDEPTGITEHQVSQESIERIKIGLFGRTDGERREIASADIEETAGIELQEVHEELEEGPEG